VDVNNNNNNKQQNNKTTVTRVWGAGGKWSGVRLTQAAHDSRAGRGRARQGEHATQRQTSPTCGASSEGAPSTVDSTWRARSPNGGFLQVCGRAGWDGRLATRSCEPVSVRACDAEHATRNERAAAAGGQPKAAGAPGALSPSAPAPSLLPSPSYAIPVRSHARPHPHTHTHTHTLALSHRPPPAAPALRACVPALPSAAAASAAASLPPAPSPLPRCERAFRSVCVLLFTLAHSVARPRPHASELLTATPPSAHASPTSRPSPIARRCFTAHLASAYRLSLSLRGPCMEPRPPSHIAR